MRSRDLKNEVYCGAVCQSENRCDNDKDDDNEVDENTFVGCCTTKRGTQIIMSSVWSVLKYSSAD